MINVLLVTGSLHIGGMESVAMNIARYSDFSMFHFDFLVYGNESYEHETEALNLGCKIHRVPFPYKNPLQYYFSLRKIMRNQGPFDIVHCHNLYNCGYVMKAAKKEKLPVRISHSHTNRLYPAKTLIRRLYERIMRYLIVKYSTEFFACSKDAGVYLFGDIFLKKGYILKNGIDTDKYAIPPEMSDKYKADLGLNDFSLIGQVGRLCPVKNHRFSLEVFNNAFPRIQHYINLQIWSPCRCSRQGFQSSE